MQKFKINLHAHTIFSDGANTPLGMALEAKELGLSALVITDHYCPMPAMKGWYLNQTTVKGLKRACKEAAKVLPVIRGIELTIGGEEVLVFGTEMINAILNVESLTIDQLVKWKRQYHSAFILCHPDNPKYWPDLLPILDGYERFNSCQDQFEGRDLGCLSGLQSWCNSDAHQAVSLGRAYNLVDSKIKNEADLIKYIKSGKQPEFYLEGES